MDSDGPGNELPADERKWYIQTAPPYAITVPAMLFGEGCQPHTGTTGSNAETSIRAQHLFTRRNAEGQQYYWSHADAPTD